MARKYDHEVHQYYLAKIGKKGWQVYRCAIPGCEHFLPHIKLMRGRKSICWGCGDDFILGVKHRRIHKPKCVNCTEGTRRTDIDKDTISELAARLASITGE